jgi:hypothetical protein
MSGPKPTLQPTKPLARAIALLLALSAQAMAVTCGSQSSDGCYTTATDLADQDRTYYGTTCPDGEYIHGEVQGDHTFALCHGEVNP